jgi:hypothetical protein
VYHIKDTNLDLTFAPRRLRDLGESCQGMVRCGPDNFATWHFFINAIKFDGSRCVSSVKFSKLLYVVCVTLYFVALFSLLYFNIKYAPCAINIYDDIR